METTTVTCPWCFEEIEISLDPHTEGAFVRDCEICCRPWDVRVVRTRGGSRRVNVTRSH